ncbi:MAG: hypothetical protein MJZ81_07235 [Bacteroidales bacterium]|nr:hypothetical protein [Bacteroidales bacterium]
MDTLATVKNQTLQDIADAIRAKGGTTETMKPGEMAAAIEALPRGGDIEEEFSAFLLNKPVVIDFAKALGYDSATPAVNAPNNMFTRCTNVTGVYAPMLNSSPNQFYGCSSIKKITMRDFANNNTQLGGCTSLEEFTTTNLYSNTVITRTVGLGIIPKTCVIHCIDKDIKYVDDAWTIVERS